MSTYGSSLLTHEWWARRLATVPRDMDRSGTVASREQAAQAMARGIDVLPLMGAPRWEPVPHVVEALRVAATQHPSVPAMGMPELRGAISAKLARENGIVADPDRQVLVTNGAKQGLDVVFSALLDPRDEVVFPTPAYVFAGSIQLAGGVPRPVPMSEAEGYRWDPLRLARAITPRTKLLLLNTPTNPTGFVAGRDDLLAMAELAERHDLVIVVDEAYERLVYDGGTHISLASLPEAAGRTVTVFSMTKAHNAVGYRVGYVTGPVPLVECAAKVLEWSVLANNFLSQAAALAILTGPQEWLRALSASCEENRTRLSMAIDRIDGISGVWPKGGTAHFINVKQLGMMGSEVSFRLLTEYGIPTVPGQVLGEDDHVRLTAVGSRPEHIGQAIERLSQACADFLASRI